MYLRQYNADEAADTKYVWEAMEDTENMATENRFKIIPSNPRIIKVEEESPV